MNLLFTHRSGGQLWQGSFEDVEELLKVPNDKISVIGLFAIEYQSLKPNEHYEIIRGGFNDKYWAGEKELKKISEVADSASDLFSDRIREGKGCLSTCAMGLNRSGLVSALTLMKVAGKEPEEAIELVRRLRGIHGGMQPLCNPRFVELIQRMRPVVGSKTAWTAWRR